MKNKFTYVCALVLVLMGFTLFNKAKATPVTAIITNSTNVSCYGGNNGNATVTASGGTAPYTYLWSDGNSQTTPTATGLTAGSYTVTVTDAASNTATASVYISEPCPLTATINSVIYPACNGGYGSALSAAYCGNAPYMYSWTPSAGFSANPALSAGTYTLTIEDANGCIATASTCVTQPPLLTATTSSTTANSSCTNPNGTATVSALGGTGAYTYLWSPTNQTTATAMGLAAYTYTCTVTDNNGCTATTEATVGGAAAPVVTLTSTIAALASCKGSIEATTVGGVSPYTYLWEPGGYTVSYVNNLCPGNYCCTVTDSGGCSATACIIVNSSSCTNPYSQPICIITLDTATNRCELVWGRTNSPPAEVPVNIMYIKILHRVMC